MPKVPRHQQMLLSLYQAVVGKAWDDVRSLLSDDFVEHNPRVPHTLGQTSGREAFVQYFSAGDTPLDNAQVDIKRFITDGEYASVHYKIVNRQYPRGAAVVDIFRVEGNQFAEHWDVIQEIPEHSANPHGMIT